jgi:hypothetical protein
MCENVLQGVSQLEGIDITETELDVCVNDEFGEAKDFAAEVKGVSESRFLSLFSGQSLDGFQIHIVIQVQVVKILAVNQKIQHVVALPTNLQTRLDPIQLRSLEELC